MRKKQQTIYLTRLGLARVAALFELQFSQLFSQSGFALPMLFVFGDQLSLHSVALFDGSVIQLLLIH